MLRLERPNTESRLGTADKMSCYWPSNEESKSNKKRKKNKVQGQHTEHKQMVIRYVQVQRSYRRLQMKVTVTVEGKEQKWEVKPKFIKKNMM